MGGGSWGGHRAKPPTGDGAREKGTREEEEEGEGGWGGGEGEERRGMGWWRRRERREREELRRAPPAPRTAISCGRGARSVVRWEETRGGKGRDGGRERGTFLGILFSSGPAALEPPPSAARQRVDSQAQTGEVKLLLSVLEITCFPAKRSSVLCELCVMDSTPFAL